MRIRPLPKQASTYRAIATDIHLLIDYLKGFIKFLRIKMPPTVTICVRSYLSTSFHDLTAASGTLIAHAVWPLISPANELATAGNRSGHAGVCPWMRMLWDGFFSYACSYLASMVRIWALRVCHLRKLMEFESCCRPPFAQSNSD